MKHNRCALRIAGVMSLTCVCGIGWTLAVAGEVRLKCGFVLVGQTAYLKSFSADPKAGVSPGDPIVVIDNELKRVYVPRLRIDQFKTDRVERLESFTVPQLGRSDAGSPIRTIGPIIRVTKFDAFGRRIFTMSTSRGPVHVIQCITRITPKYVVVEAYKKYKWKQYIATTSLPQDTLHRLIMKSIKPKVRRERERVVRFYLQLERFKVAEQVLAKLLEQFPERKDVYKRMLRDIRQISARKLLAEIKLRANAGQHHLAHTLLSAFPAKGVAGAILQEVALMLEDYQDQRDQHVAVLMRLKKDIDRLVAKDANHKQQLEAIGEEIIHGDKKKNINGLSIHTLERMAAYEQLNGDPAATLEQKVAAAISGWTQGAKNATTNLTVALSLYDVRRLVRAYFNAELKIDRIEILKRLRRLEGATPKRIAQLLRHMAPPKDTPFSTNGFHQLSVDGLPGGAPISYSVQLPPEYNPHRRYPTVVTLHGAGTSPKLQTDWWAGGLDAKKNRRGHGTRHGYIVIAPAWGEQHQLKYGFSLREHVAVLNCLRDAGRRFSIDSDRVFLSGHSMGGAAAWDIGLAHPDLFAGVIPISTQCEKYCDLYWQNARYLPIYYVCGEMDGGKLATSAMSLDRYMKRYFPVTVSEFIGRGHEEFSDEVLNLFDWMSRQRRNVSLRDFTCATKRPWDNFFWWIEMHQLPEKAMVRPEDWGKKRKGGPFLIGGKIATQNSLFVKGGAGRITVWLSPDLINFNLPLYLTVNGRRHHIKIADLRSDIEVILEDVRTRGDRLHPFWTKFVFTGAHRAGADKPRVNKLTAKRVR